MRSIGRWLQRQYEKVRSKGLKSVPETRYQNIPKAARISNPLSNRAAFAPCVYRRRGYLAQVAAEQFAALLPDKTLSFERKEELENAWLRGVIWPPVLCVGSVKDGRWVLDSCRDSEIVLFLEGRQKLLSIQILEPDDAPATRENLNTLKAGLFTRSGKRCPVVFARATY